MQLNQFGLLVSVSAICSFEFQLCNVSMKCMSVAMSFVLKLRGCFARYMNYAFAKLLLRLCNLSCLLCLVNLEIERTEARIFMLSFCL